MDGVSRGACVDPDAMMIAQMVAHLEEQEDAQREARQASREARRGSIQHQVAEMREAADAEYIGSVVQATCNGLSAAHQVAAADALEEAQRSGKSESPEANRLNACSRAIDALGGGVQAQLKHAADDARADATELGALAEDHAGAAEDMREEAGRSRGFQDKALGHLADIENARRQAQLAATRG